jgi:hypothetical protein
MTIRVKIGPIEKDIADVDPSWINEQINRRREAEASVCVQVSIERDSVRLHLATSNCPHSRGSSRPLTTQENEILSLWKKLHLNEDSFTGGNLIAFLRQIR